MNLVARSTILTLLWFGLTQSSHSHQDTVLTLKEGQLGGLPKEYSPATFDLKTKKLSIGNREVIFAPYVADLFPEDGEYDLRISASWYHEQVQPDSLPPYINFKIQKKEWDFSYTILINLASLELIECQIEVQESKSRMRYFVLDLASFSEELTRWKPTLRNEKSSNKSEMATPRKPSD